MLIVGEPQLRVAVLREHPFRLDHRLNDDGVERTGGKLDPLATQHPDGHGIAIGLEVALELVRASDLERQRADEVHEGTIIERFGDRWLLTLVVRAVVVRSPLGEDLVATLALLLTLVLALIEAERGHIVRREPALE